MTLTIKGATTIKASTTVGFQPGSLFAAGEQGVWYDPSDMTTMFQDVAGTTPVTAMEQSVGLLLDKRNPAYSVYFDGTGDYISTSSANFAFGTGDFTIEALVYTSDVSATTQKGWFQTSSNAGGLYNSYTSGVAIYYGNGGAGRASINVGGTEYTSSTSVISTNTWYHIAVTRSSGTVRLFVNGVLVASGSGNTSNLTGQNASIGGYYDSNFLLPGYISNLRVISGISLYTAAFTPPTGPLTPASNTTLLTCGTSWSGNPAFTINGNCVAKNLNPFGASIGNHATQSTAANRPVLSARVNYLLTTDNLLSGNWQTVNGGTGGPCSITAVPGAGPNGETAYRLQATKTGTSESDYSLFRNANVLFPTSSFSLVFSIMIKSNTGSNQNVWGPAYQNYLTATSNWQRITQSFSVVNDNGQFVYQIGARGTSDNNIDVLICFPDLRAANQGVNLPVYQRVNTATDYDTTNFPYYLKFDGTNDFLDFTALAISNQTIFMSMSPASIITAASTQQALLDTTTGETSVIAIGGATSTLTNERISWLTTISGIVYGSGQISEDFAVNPYVLTFMYTSTPTTGYRRNGVVKTLTDTSGLYSGGAFSSGVYPTNYARIGARGSGNSAFAGNIYGLIIRGAASSTQQIQATEAYLNRKTKAY